MNNQREKLLEQLLTALEDNLIETRTSEDEITEEAYALMRTLVSKDFLNTFNITKLLLEETMSTGEIKAYSKKELVQILPWENTQLWLKLKELVEEGILLNEKRKYQLNVEHPFVKRVKQAVRINMEGQDFEKDFKGFLQETAGKKQSQQNKESVLNNESSNDRKVDKQKQYRQVTSDELEAFVNNMRTTYFEHLVNSTEEEVIDDLAKLIEKNILMTIGMTEIKE